jgi:hypothetical protein
MSGDYEKGDFIMPVTTKMAKSGVKNVFKKKRTNLDGRLNRAARNVNREEADRLTPGVVGELFDQKKNQQQKKRQQAILDNRRRRR